MYVALWQSHNWVAISEFADGEMSLAELLKMIDFTKNEQLNSAIVKCFRTKCCKGEGILLPG